ncbi:sensor histidine kinase [Microvirga arabica]|uniref:Blue-light-activated histidine kinase n=1 Tax=Microvirga arabica TaxID=1128671 RepID=A0ABV6Y9R5_9HYPH|nr:PAS domain S-box protein [Microvirga arabica]MBM1174427.1 PAS domain S-box protein [Microvirga arabica]
MTSFASTGTVDSGRQVHFQAQLLNAVEQAIIATDLAGVVTYWNRCAERLYGWAAEEALGRNILELNIPPEGLPQAEEIMDCLRAGKMWSGDVILRHKDGHSFPVQVTDSPVLDDGGQMVGIVGISMEIGDRVRTLAALTSSEERLRIAQHAGGIGTFEWNIRSGEVMVTEEFCRIWGIGQHTSIRVGAFEEFTHPDDRDLLATSLARPLEDLIGYTEYRIIRQDDRQVRWLARRGEIVRNEAGEPSRVIGAVYDITDRKRAEEQRQLLMQELAHRVKNTLAMVQAISTQTMRSAASLEEAGTIFGERLTALARANDTLLQENWSSASIRVIVEGAIQSHNDHGRIHCSGPDIRLGPKAALALSLALHELCTNAAKYGALSMETGQVEITWHVAGDKDAALFRFRWQESGGPPVKAPERKGFGSRLIERSLAGSFGGQAGIRYEPTGIVWSIETPLSALQEPSSG